MEGNLTCVATPRPVFSLLVAFINQNTANKSQIGTIWIELLLGFHLVFSSSGVQRLHAVTTLIVTKDV